MRQPFSYSQIYNTIEKAEAYWKKIAPDTEAGVSVCEKWLNQANFLSQVTSQTPVAIAIWDANENRFIFVSDSNRVLGHDESLFLSENGVDFSLSNFHPDYLNAVLISQMKGVECVLEHSAEQARKIIFSFDGLYRHGNGNYIHLLQQIVPLEFNEEGQPVLYLSYTHDITHLKKELSVNLIVAAPDKLRMWEFDFDRKDLKEMRPFTTQEKHVLSALSRGKDTKTIATELNLSPHTVDTHRRNLLKKTNCIDTTAAVTFARMVGLI